MKKAKVILAAGLTLLMAASPLTSFAETAAASADHGDGLQSIEAPVRAYENRECGDRLTFEIKDKILYINGTGDMDNWIDAYNWAVSSAVSPFYLRHDYISSAVVADGVTSIGDYAFQGCELNNISLPATVRSIGSYAFYDCQSLKTLVINDGCTTIKDNAFRLTTDLKTLTIPASVKYIGENAFCDSTVKDIYYLGSEADWKKIDNKAEIPSGAVIHYSSTYDQSFDWDEATKTLTIKSKGAMADNKPYTAHKSDAEHLIIKSGTTYIGAEAFKDYTAVKYVTLPHSLTGIGKDAFKGCTSLIHVYYAGSKEEYDKLNIEKGVYDGRGLMHYATEAGDRWPIANAQQVFYDEDDHKVSWENSYSIYNAHEGNMNILRRAGEFINTGFKRLISGTWTGSCNGMSLLECAQINGQIDIRRAAGITDKHGMLSQYGYDHFDSSEGLYVAKGNQRLVDMIEKAQWAQFSYELDKSEVKIDANEAKDSLTGNDYPLMLGIETPTGGHAVVIPPHSKAIDKGNGAYEIYVDDTNAPQIDRDMVEDKWIRSVVNGPRSYLRIKDGHYSLYQYSSDENKYVEAYTNRSAWTFGTWFHFYDIRKLPSDFFSGSEYSLSGPDQSFYVSGGSNFSVVSESGETMLNVKNGEMTMKSDDTSIVSFTGAASSSASQGDTFAYRLPVGKYNVISTGSSFKIFKAGDSDRKTAYAEINGVTKVAIDDSTNSFDVYNTGSGSEQITEYKSYNGGDNYKEISGNLHGESSIITKDKGKDLSWQSTSPLGSISVDEGLTDDFPFTDIDDSHWAIKAVKWAISQKITAGTSAATFSPGKMCSRAEIVTFIWRSCGSPEPVTTRNPFRDVKSSDYYYKAVLWAEQSAITSGTSEGVFSPDAECSRAEAVTFIYRAKGYPAGMSAVSFKDVVRDSFYYNAVSWAVAENITAGKGDNRFAPDDSCSRAEIVSFLYRARDL